MIKYKVSADNPDIYKNLLTYLENSRVKVHISYPNRKWIYTGELANITIEDIRKIGGEIHETFDLERDDGG